MAERVGSRDSANGELPSARRERRGNYDVSITRLVTVGVDGYCAVKVAGSEG